MTGSGVCEEHTVLIQDGVIHAVSREPAIADGTLEFEDGYIIPGFVDLQVNGAFGIDIATHPGRLEQLSRKLVDTGVTSYLPAIISLPRNRYGPVLAQLDSAMGKGAEVLGVHLEGPFINPDKRGVHRSENIIPPDPELLEGMLDSTMVRMLTLAPEIPGANGLVELALNRGVTVSLGHSAAGFEVAYKALNAGASSVTHLFNAMSPLHHRDPGLSGAALTHPQAACGIIADKKHVHPAILQLAFQTLGPDRLYLVTDAVSAAGMASGEYTLAGERIFLDNGVPRLRTGTIAGSALTMNEALKNMMEITGCTIAEAVRMTSTTPARVIGEENRKGRLTPGYDADIVVLSPRLQVEAVWVKGEPVFHRTDVQRVGGGA